MSVAMLKFCPRASAHLTVKGLCIASGLVHVQMCHMYLSNITASQNADHGECALLSPSMIYKCIDEGTVGQPRADLSLAVTCTQRV